MTATKRRQVTIAQAYEIAKATGRGVEITAARAAFQARRDGNKDSVLRLLGIALRRAPGKYALVG